MKLYKYFEILSLEKFKESKEKQFAYFPKKERNPETNLPTKEKTEREQARQERLKKLLKIFFTVPGSKLPKRNIIIPLTKSANSSIVMYKENGIDEEIISYLRMRGNFTVNSSLYFTNTMNNHKGSPISITNTLKEIKNYDLDKLNKSLEKIDNPDFKESIKRKIILKEYYKEEYLERVELLFDNKEYKIVFTWVPRKIASQSTETGWTSCMNLYSGVNKHYIFPSIDNGAFIAWLVKPGDEHKLNKPIARVLIKPVMVNFNSYEPNASTEVFWTVANKVYGTAPDNFRDKVKEFISEKLKNHVDKKSYDIKEYRNYKIDTYNDHDEFEITDLADAGLIKTLDEATIEDFITIFTKGSDTGLSEIILKTLKKKYDDDFAKLITDIFIFLRGTEKEHYIRNSIFFILKRVPQDTILDTANRIINNKYGLENKEIMSILFIINRFFYQRNELPDFIKSVFHYISNQENYIDLTVNYIHKIAGQGPGFTLIFDNILFYNIVKPKGFDLTSNEIMNFVKSANVTDNRNTVNRFYSDDNFREYLTKIFDTYENIVNLVPLKELSVKSYKNVITYTNTRFNVNNPKSYLNENFVEEFDLKLQSSEYKKIIPRNNHAPYSINYTLFLNQRINTAKKAIERANRSLFLKLQLLEDKTISDLVKYMTRASIVYNSRNYISAFNDYAIFLARNVLSQYSHIFDIFNDNPFYYIKEDKYCTEEELEIKKEFFEKTINPYYSLDISFYKAAVKELNKTLDNDIFKEFLTRMTVAFNKKISNSVKKAPESSWGYGSPEFKENAKKALANIHDVKTFIIRYLTESIESRQERNIEQHSKFLKVTLTEVDLSSEEVDYKKLFKDIVTENNVILPEVKLKKAPAKKAPAKKAARKKRTK